MSKSDFIRLMFNDISHKYDFLNDVLSVGTHRLWKKKLIRLALENRPKSALDCATGTGDIAFELKKHCPGQVVGIDFSQGMIDHARVRENKGKLQVDFRVADVEKLPFSDKSFDITTISFGIRNVENLSVGLKELGRVAKGVYILEFGRPKNTLFKKFYFGMLRLYVPLFGLISKRKDAYEYLISSSEAFPSGEEFVSLMKKNMSFKNFGYIPVFGGIAYLYFARNEELV
ncbi:MAG: ubiquinone/menaquinone biosynthesis methyltransferase [Alphaproteobacteria bacterium]|nr:ubiquinone/menaquinone biosynthesis methyltransferase [Alphaproteobacteria bacterium]